MNSGCSSSFLRDECDILVSILVARLVSRPFWSRDLVSSSFHRGHEIIHDGMIMSSMTILFFLSQDCHRNHQGCKHFSSPSVHCFDSICPSGSYLCVIKFSPEHILLVAACEHHFSFSIQQMHLSKEVWLWHKPWTEKEVSKMSSGIHQVVCKSHLVWFRGVGVG